MRTKAFDTLSAAVKFLTEIIDIEVAQMDLGELQVALFQKKISEKQATLWFNLRALGFQADTPEMTELVRLARENLLHAN